MNGLWEFSIRIEMTGCCPAFPTLQTREDPLVVIVHFS